MAVQVLHLDIEDYLAQWLIHDQGGENPIKLKRGSVEKLILEQFLQPLSDSPEETASNGGVDIIIPNLPFRTAPQGYFLPPKATAALVRCIRNRFDVVLWDALHRVSPYFQRQDELIYAFMEKHGIELTEQNWNAIAKRYQRKRTYYLTYERTKKMKSNRKKETANLRNIGINTQTL